jgi:hypothetical protein
MSTALHTDRFEAIDAWGIIFILTGSPGAFLALRRFAALRWIAASLPFWAFGTAHDAFAIAAVALVVGGLIAAFVGPTLPGRRMRRDARPLEHLAGGPLTTVESRVYFGGVRVRWLTITAWTLAVLGVVLLAVAGAGVIDPALGGLGLAAEIMAGTFAFSNWFAGRVRLRIDQTGLHSRTLFREHTIGWAELAGLTIRYLFLPGSGIRLVYYVAYSPNREFAFLSTMKGAGELQAAIESATGLRWPEPEITGNF